MSAALVVENVCKSFAASSILKGVSCTLQAGDVVLLSGANGIGKSTLLSCLAGLLGLTSGRVELRGIGSVGSEGYQRSIGYAGDSLLLYEQLTVRENLEFWSRIYKATRAELARLCELFMLQPFLDKPIKHCSLGMRRRVALARSLLHSPKLVCWDEPFVGIDTQRKAALQQIVTQYVEQGSIFIISSHEEISFEVSVRRALLADGVLSISDVVGVA